MQAGRADDARPSPRSRRRRHAAGGSAGRRSAARPRGRAGRRRSIVVMSAPACAVLAGPCGRSTALWIELQRLALLGPRRAGRPCALGVGQLAFELAVSWPGGPARASRRRARARTAQPGSPSWRQSLKRHVAASSAMSSNAVSTPSSAPATSSERMPGVSMSRAPPGSANSSRWVVVWRPRESSSRTSPVGLALLAEERVDERRLADARRAEHDRGPAGRQVRREVRDVVAGQRRQDDDRDARRDRLDRHEPAVEVVGRCRPC